MPAPAAGEHTSLAGSSSSISLVARFKSAWIHPR